MASLNKPGWHDRGYLPHFDANGVLQHVVFRTFGSITPDVMAKVHELPEPERAKALDRFLDNSVSGQLFENSKCADIMQNCLKFFDRQRYDLQAWCIMPTHVHVLLVADQNVRLGQCVHSWKNAATRALKAELGLSGPFFAKDYFDRFCRTLRQAEATIGYIEANPVKAGFCYKQEDWPWSSACARRQNWRPSHERLPVLLN
jgi:putative transposase